MSEPARRTYGELSRSADRRLWLMRCEPQVTIRVKRIFAKGDVGVPGGVSLADTVETCRELLWLLERYPMEMHASDRNYLARRASVHRKLERDVSGILGAEYTPGKYELALPPRDYQRVAADLLHRRGSLLLADDVGLGKTAVGICSMLLPDALPALVVTLAHLPRQWQREIEKFAPALTTHVLRSGKPYDLTRARGKKVKHPDVILSSYHKLSGWNDLAGRVRTIIFDEAQELRHGGTQKYRAASFIASKADRRLMLSATPIYNYGGEIYNVLSVIAPDELGSQSEFLREWCRTQQGYGGQDKAIIKDPKALGHYLREQGLMLRRTRKEVGRELPPVTVVPHHIDADLAALEAVATPAAQLARIILAQGGRGFEKMRAAEELDWRLRQATGIAKAPFVADFVRLLVESGEPVVLYGWHREVYSLWMERLNDLKPIMYTGSESVAEKERAKEAFLSGQSNILVISLRSGAGLDGLQERGRTVVFGEIDWSPGVHEQCIGRLARDGQAGNVFAYYLLAEAGSDPVIADALGLKRQQIDGLRDPTAPVVQGTVDIDRVKKLAESFLEQQSRLRASNNPQVTEEAA